MNLFIFRVFQKSAVGVHVSQEADDWFAEYLNVKGCQLFCFQLGGKPRFSDDNNGKVANYSNEKDTVNHFVFVSMETFVACEM